jgi:hypothetical protein
MSDQANEANKFARTHFGGEVDAAAGASGLKVLTNEGDGGNGSGGDNAPKKVWVELPGSGHRDIADFARELGAVLADTPVFRREGLSLPVTVDAVTGDVALMTPKRFMSWVSDWVNVYEDCDVGRGDKRTTVRLRKTMPKTTAECVLEADVFLHQLRPLVRVNTVRAPWMQPDGKPVLLPEGYHEGSQIYTIKSAVQIDEGMALERARLLLSEYYGEFTFTDLRSQAVAITEALALWAIGLQSVEAARPGFMFRANTQGGGKSLLAQMGITPAYGLPENTAKAKEDELRKILDAAVLQGVPYLFFDNLKGHFENALVEGFMTTPVWRARVMGTQKFMRGKVCSILIITGNNLTVSPDMQRRLLQCDVFVEEFDLQEKEHKRDLNPVVLNRPAVRGEFLSALWAMIRNWYEKGRPPAGTREKPFRLATFAEWSDIFGGIVQAAGYANPLERPRDDQVAAPITMHQRKLVELLATPPDGDKVDEKNPMLEYQFQGLIDICHEHELFGWKMKGKERSDDSGAQWFELTSEAASTIGLMFTNEMGKRIFALPDGRRIRFGKHGEGRAKRYTVEFVSRAV